MFRILFNNENDLFSTILSDYIVSDSSPVEENIVCDGMFFWKEALKWNMTK